MQDRPDRAGTPAGDGLHRPGLAALLEIRLGDAEAAGRKRFGIAAEIAVLVRGFAGRHAGPACYQLARRRNGRRRLRRGDAGRRGGRLAGIHGGKQKRLRLRGDRGSRAGDKIERHADERSLFLLALLHRTRTRQARDVRILGGALLDIGRIVRRSRNDDGGEFRLAGDGCRDRLAFLVGSS